MLIELATLPPALQTQILYTDQVQIVNNGTIVATFAKNTEQNERLSAIDDVFGMLKGKIGDGLDFERKQREW